MKELTLSSFLLFVSHLLNVQGYPAESSPWKIIQSWHKNSTNYNESTLEIKSQDLNCRPGQVLELPNIIHASQFVYLNSRLIFTFGAKDFEWSQSFYGKPILNCNLIQSDGAIQWKIITTSDYFSRIGEWPQITNKISPVSSNEILNISAFGGLIIITIYLMMFTWRTEIFKMGLALSGFSIFMSIFFLLSVSGLLEIRLALTTVHRVADLCLGFAGISMIFYLRMRKLIQDYLSKFLIAAIVICNTCIFLFSTEDGIQFGTTILFIPIGATLWVGMANQIKSYRQISIIGSIQNILGLGIFAVTSTSDILYTFGLHTMPIVLPYGILGSVFFIVQSIQQEVLVTYKERDYLRLNLEKEVERKTFELKAAQAELIQSAKLASLGTLVAGIAHEINNSVNYVNGALVPLENIIEKNITDPAQKTKIAKLLAVMKDGLSLTVGIIKSLRTYTGLNQAKFNDVDLTDVVKSALMILKNKVHNIEVDLKIEDGLQVYGSVVGLNQVFMNLITNSVDAMSKGGKLTIVANKKDFIDISVSDTGDGIKSENLERIFDPFFTTKGVGKGTGLGLHIVMKEIQAHNATMDVSSEVGKGTTFRLKFPITEMTKNKVGKAA